MASVDAQTAIDGYSDFRKIKEERGYAIYRAYDDVAARKVLLRVFKRNLDKETKLRQNCADELRALSRLYHPNILPTVGFGLWRNNPYLVTLNLEGQSLQQEIREERLQLQDKYRVAIGLLRALQHVHRNDLIHGDLFPEHVIIGEKNQIYLTGFCLRSLYDTFEVSANMVCGERFEYLAPERKDDARLFSQATDIYALGALFYYLFLGEPAKGADLMALLQGGDVEASLRRMIGRMLMPEPHRRALDYESAIRMLQRLAIGLEGSPIDVLNSGLVRQVLPVNRFVFLETMDECFGDIVYLYEDRLRNRIVSVKSRPMNAIGLAAAQRLEGELHPHIVRVFGVASDKETYLVVSEYRSGGTLMSRMAFPWPEEDGFDFAEKMLSALAHASKLRVIHGHVRPWHILFDEYGSPALTDFAMGQTRMNQADLDQGYFIPGEVPSERSDLFALGTVVYELIVGERPHFLGKVLNKPPRFKNIQPEVRDVLEKLLQIEPQNRYRDASQALQALQVALGKLPSDVLLEQSLPKIEPDPALEHHVHPSTEAGYKLENNSGVLMAVIVLLFFAMGLGFVAWKTSDQGIQDDAKSHSNAITLKGNEREK